MRGGAGGQGPEEAKKAAARGWRRPKKLLDQINADAAELNRQLDDEMEGRGGDPGVRSPGSRSNWRSECRQTMSPSTPGTNLPVAAARLLPAYLPCSATVFTPSPARPTAIPASTSPPWRTPIQACKSGQVVTSAYHYSYGNYVVIDHGNSNSTLYAHMSSRAVSEGQMVSQGQTIGYVGTTGGSTGNHLHLEVRATPVWTRRASSPA